MGHLTLISEDVIGALEHFPPDLRLLVAQYAPQPAWDEYVSGRYKETKKRDSELLGGGKPVVAGGPRGGAASWRVDEADAGAAASAAQEQGEDAGGEFRRGARARESSADFAAGNMDEDEDEFRDGPPHVRVCLSQSCGGVCADAREPVCALPGAGDAVRRTGRWRRLVGRGRRGERVARALDVRSAAAAGAGAAARRRPAPVGRERFRRASCSPLHPRV